VENTSAGMSCTVRVDKASSAISENRMRKMSLTWTKNRPSSSEDPCIAGRGTSIRSSSTTLWNDTPEYCALLALYFNDKYESPPHFRVRAHHKYTPTLSTWAVAKKSFVGENAMLVATLGVRKASIRHPVGRSKVRIVESRELATSHRESGEKAWMLKF